jgi:hypothetical protein
MKERSAHVNLKPGVFDITTAICYRMAPIDLRAQLVRPDPLPPALLDRVASRFYASLREEAFLCAAATQQRGVVSLRKEEISYVLESRINPLFDHLHPDTKGTLSSTVSAYDPWREAVILVLCEGWSSVQLAHENDRTKWLGYWRLPRP